jgi:hypothetical protein
MSLETRFDKHEREKRRLTSEGAGDAEIIRRIDLSLPRNLIPLIFLGG